MAENRPVCRTDPGSDDQRYSACRPPILDGRQSNRRHIDSRASQTTRGALHPRATGKALTMPTMRRLPIAPRRQMLPTLVIGFCTFLLASSPSAAAEIAPTKFVTANGITVLVLERSEEHTSELQ